MARSPRSSVRATRPGSKAAIADPRVALDITPWWADATDGHYLLNRALALMWLDVRWRTPAMEGERRAPRRGPSAPPRAYPMDPSLPYPWRAWAELVALRGINDPMARQVVDPGRARRRRPDPPIGYRRDPVTISHEGWALEIPGSYAERRTAEEWWGGGAGRNITLAAVQTGTADGAMSAQAFIDQFARRPRVPMPSTIAPSAVVGRARLIDRRELRCRGRRPRGLLGGPRLGRGDPDRVRRPGRLAVGARHVAVPPQAEPSRTLGW